MDMREIYDFDKEYLTGAKAPLIIRMPHARMRPNNSMCFEALFQVLICLIVNSKLKNFETSSYFTYTEQSRNLRLPDKGIGIIPMLLPEKLKIIDKSMQGSKSIRFVMQEHENGLHLHKGFKKMTEVFMGTAKLEWLEFNCRVFKPLLPIRMRLQKIT